MAKQRLLFLDIIRIASIAMIVASHVWMYSNLWIFKFYYNFHGLILYTGGIGVYMLIFVSGAALAISYPLEKVFKNLNGFYIQRLLRIYPAFWVSMAISIIMAPILLTKVKPAIIIPMITGFTAFVGEWGGPIAGPYWFIGLLTVLYLLYPFVVKFIDWNPLVAMAVLILVSAVSLVSLDTSNITGITRWFPTCNLAFFGAGIFCIKTGFYPKTTTNLTTITYLAELSFFVFLYHDSQPIIAIARVNLPVYFILVIGICITAKHLDDHIQDFIKRSQNSGINPKQFQDGGSK